MSLKGALDWVLLALAPFWAAMIVSQLLKRKIAGAVLVDLGSRRDPEARIVLGVAIILLGAAVILLGDRSFGIYHVLFGAAWLVQSSGRLRICQAGILNLGWSFVRWESIEAYGLAADGRLGLKIIGKGWRIWGVVDGRADRQQIADLFSERMIGPA